ncbi:MAG TPA: HAD-IA family hydrolase [Terriglobia bacterium]|nr:HAD-IA family hydrolase [Terriglobia bacterium]
MTASGRGGPVLIFDLDGTLIDSKQDLTASVNHVRERFGLEPLGAAVIATFIGDGAAMLIRRALGGEAAESDVQSGLETFLSYYRAHMLDRTTLYPEALETLDQLAGKCQLAVLTNKPVRFSREILEGLGVIRRFAAVYGGNSFERKKPDPIGIHRILEETGGRPGMTWMIGDSAVDVRTGRNAGVSTCGVTWGYATKTFADAPPDVLIHRFSELPRSILL